MKSRNRSLAAKRRKPDNYRDRLFRYWHIDHEVVCQQRVFRVSINAQVLVTP